MTAAVERARELGYVDDRAMAEAVVRRRLASGRGLALVRRELASKGIERDVVDAVLVALEPEDAFEQLAAEAARLAARHAGEPEARRREKVLAGLVRRGHSGAAARRAWEYLKQAPE